VALADGCCTPAVFSCPFFTHQLKQKKTGCPRQGPDTGQTDAAHQTTVSSFPLFTPNNGLLLSTLYSSSNKTKNAGCPHQGCAESITHLLQQVDGGLEVQAKVDELPLDALPLVLLLLQDEHGVVEQLLQLLVCVVDAQLLKRVHLQPQIPTT